MLSRAARAPDAVVCYGPRADQIVDLYRAHGAARALVILVHGGYWRPQYDRVHLRPMAQALAAAGWTVGLPEYARVPGDPDGMLADVELAVRRLPQLIRQGDEGVAQGGDRGRVIIAGHSAGGHLALCVAAQAEPLAGASLAGVLALAPVADLLQADALNVDDGAVRDFLGEPAAKRPDLDPCRLPAPAMPVTLLHGDADSFAPQNLSRSYVAVHPQTRAVWLPGAGHFALIDPQSGVWTVVLEELERLFT